MSFFDRLFNRTPEPPVRRALDVLTGQPVPYVLPPQQWLQGYLTHAGLAITAIGAIGRCFGWNLPTEDVQGIVTWLEAHWNDLAQVVGLCAAAYGRMRIEWRSHQSTLTQ